MTERTTPARAEAQDEGAAGEPVAWQKRFYDIDGKPSAWEQTEAPTPQANAMSRIVEYRPLYAHPSPTPAASVCDACGDKGYVESEGGDGEGWPSKPEIEACPRCAPPPAADADRVRIAVQNGVARSMAADDQWKELSPPARAVLMLNVCRHVNEALAALKSEGK